MADILHTTWDGAKVRNSSSSDLVWCLSDLNAAAIAEITIALSDFEQLRLRALVLGFVALELQRHAKWCEGCWCHDHLPQPGEGKPEIIRQRHQAWKRTSEGCPWKGWRGTELAAGRLAYIFASIEQFRASLGGRTCLMRRSIADRGVGDGARDQGEVVGAIAFEVGVLVPLAIPPLGDLLFQAERLRRQRPPHCERMLAGAG